ncbi:MAG: NifB/NifX family molybdenum-iron cluster-binding protein [Bulleidia sp.]
MKIAVTYENECVFQHFGRTTQFAVYTVNEDNTVNKQVLGTDGASHGALADFLAGLGVDVVICGGLGMGIYTRMVNAGMKVYGGVSGGL